MSKQQPKKQKNLSPKYQPWVDARERFHLSHAHVQMARELGLNPKKLGGKANHDQEPWKLPLPQFIEKLYIKHFGRERPDNVRSVEQMVCDRKQKKSAMKEARKQASATVAGITSAATIRQAAGPADMDEVHRLFREYEAFLGVDLCFQNFETELAGLPGRYAPPGGALLIARTGDRVVGCVALRALDQSICEMKRLYVRPEARSMGLGRRLACEAIDLALHLGYSQMRLDTLDRLTEAMRIYETLGFTRIPPYYSNPLPGVVYWELNLKSEWFW